MLYSVKLEVEELSMVNKDLTKFWNGSLSIKGVEGGKE